MSASTANYTKTIQIGRVKVAWYTPVYLASGILSIILGIYSIQSGAPMGAAAIGAGLVVALLGSTITKRSVAFLEKTLKR